MRSVVVPVAATMRLARRAGVRLGLTATMLLAFTGCTKDERKQQEPESAPQKTASSPEAPTREPAPNRRIAVSTKDAEYVGSGACAACHEAQVTAHRGSDHDLAMQRPSADTVLGDFTHAPIEHGGTRVQFSREQQRSVMKLPGADDKLQDFVVGYVFGVYPLQQYLAEVRPGEYQALPFAWDTRPEAEGGKRWFHIYGREVIARGDALHWTSPNQNWNHMCADCHSTNVDKGFDARAGTFTTTYSEIDVACEACHGPASRHVERARTGKLDSGLGLTRYFAKRAERAWSFEGGGRIAKLTRPPEGAPEHETCAACHSLRSDLGRAAEGHAFADRYRLQLVEPPFYFDDGQIKEEVYVYGSFLQSKMAHAGVTCSDCHDPHSTDVYVQGNGLCAQCHNPSVFDSPSHHFHSDGKGAQCTACHMPERTYMQVDPRRDHRFGVPRPLESQSLGAPLSCLDCHEGKSNTWAQAAIEAHRKSTPTHVAASERKWPALLVAARADRAAAIDELAALVVEDELPDIIRASAVEVLGRSLRPPAAPLLAQLAAAKSPLVRRSVATATAALSPSERGALLLPLLSDDARSVRLEAVGRLLHDSQQGWSPQARQSFDAAVAEFRSSHEQNADRVESLMALAELESSRGDVAAAITLLKQAIERDPSSAMSHVNLAELQRNTGDEAAAQKTLTAALEVVDNRAPVEHALGLSLVRSKRRAEALRHLEAAYRTQPSERQFAFVYAVALAESDLRASLAVLTQLRERYPDDPTLTRAIADYERQLRAQQQGQ